MKLYYLNTLEVSPLNVIIQQLRILQDYAGDRRRSREAAPFHRREAERKRPLQEA